MTAAETLLDRIVPVVRQRLPADIGGAYLGEGSWGLASDACQTGYVTFTNSYTCTQTDVDKLEEEGRTCALITFEDGTTALEQSPCTGGIVSEGESSCVFQPRVSVIDNWGWCTGFCDGGSDETDECYQGSTLADQECDIQNCPSSTGACDASADTGTYANPWINFNGYVIVTPP